MGCRYCNSDTDIDFCNDMCKNMYDEYMEFENKTKYWCILGLIAGMIVAIGGSFFNKVCGPIGILIIAFTMISFPLMTEWDIKHCGVKKSKDIIRAIGVILVIIAIAIFILMAI